MSFQEQPRNRILMSVFKYLFWFLKYLLAQYAHLINLMEKLTQQCLYPQIFVHDFSDLEIKLIVHI